MNCMDCNYRLLPGKKCWHINHLNRTIRVFKFLFGCERYRPWWEHTGRGGHEL